MDPAKKPRDPDADRLERLTARERGRVLERALEEAGVGPEALDQLDDADPEAVLRWLETGEGDPWGESRD